MRGALALLLVASSAFGMTSFDTSAAIPPSNLDDSYAISSAQRMQLRIVRPKRSIASTPTLPSKVARQMRPEWSGQSCSAQTVNGSYLAHLEYREEGLNDKVFGSGDTRGLRTDYENMVARDEARQNAGLNESLDEAGRFQAMKDLARRAMHIFTKLHIKQETSGLKSFAENRAGLREPMAAAVLAASLYTGRIMRFKLTDGVHVESRAALKDKQASVSMNLPGQGLTSTVAYNHDDLFNASLAKSITPSVSAVAGTSATQKGSAQIVYSVSF